MVARVAPSKGHVFAIAAFAELADSYPNLKLVFVGATGNSVDELRNQVASLELQDKVIFLGAKSNPYTWMKHCRMALLCSQYSESFGLVVLEYMAFNRPIIVSDIPQLVDAFGDAINYFVSQNSHSLALKMLEILQHDSTTDLIDKYKPVLEKYSLSHATSCFEDLLLQVINN
jgi:glycosyltransferase involved in cell wall biosynthesis